MKYKVITYISRKDVQIIRRKKIQSNQSSAELLWLQDVDDPTLQLYPKIIIAIQTFKEIVFQWFGFFFS